MTEQLEPPALTPWPHDHLPTESALDRILAAEGLDPHWWGNAAFDRYAAHEHTYHKVLFCLSGSITFTVHPGGHQFTLNPGDRLDLPPQTQHAASVGPRGCRCVEGWRLAEPLQ